MEMKTYEMVYECINCGYKLFKEIPYGEEAPQIRGFDKVFPDEVCPYCGCIHFFNPRPPQVGEHSGGGIKSKK